MSFFIDSALNLIAYLDTGLGIIIFSLIYIIVVLMILPASWLSLLAGFLYGTFTGSLIVFINAFLGASISFFISKQFFSKKVKQILNKFDKLSVLEKILQKGGIKLIILTRLSPLFPFSILNYFYGFNKISYKNFAIGLLFILPGTFLYCSLGNLANSINDIKNLSVNDNFFLTLISVLSTALIFYLLTKYANQIISDSKEN